MASPHQKKLEDLCRVCGQKLQKSKGTVSSKFECQKWKDFLAENFQIFVEKDLEEIHPQYFCHACYAHPDRRNVVPAIWITHYDDNCSVCTRTREIKKGGRPKKVRRGRKPDLAGPSKALLNPPQDLQDLDTLTKDMPSLRSDNFSERFSFPEDLRKDLLCPVCIQILEKPVETTCQHHFCVECMKGVIDSGQRGSCPVCKENIGLLTKPTRLVLKLIAEQKVICNNCGNSVEYEHSAKHVCGDTTAQEIATTSQQPVVAPQPAQGLQQILKDVQAGQFSSEVEKICTAYVKKKLKESEDGKTVLFKTGGKVF